jgi:hypothetical protein
MLRGNHETRDVNGWEEHYGDRSFLRQCKARFGVDMGTPTIIASHNEHLMTSTHDQSRQSLIVQ